jgi:hypothetical protein
MRRIFLGWLFAVFLWSPAAFPKDKVKPLPLFMDPEFQFSQVGTICLTPGLDLRPDQTKPLTLSEQGPRLDFQHIQSANQVAAGIFKHIGYETADCKAVSATLSDLRAPSETWLRTLDFGQSNWLFIFAVEDAPTLGWSHVHAVVSGLLFEKRGASVRLVWRDRTVGASNVTTTGRRKSETSVNSALALDDGILHILAEFEQRKGRFLGLGFAVDEENFAASCDAVWAALNDVFNSDSKRYKVRFTDASEKMALFTVYHITFGGLAENENHIVLRAHENACVMQFTQSFNDKRTDDWDELAKRMRASLPKR